MKKGKLILCLIKELEKFMQNQLKRKKIEENSKLNKRVKLPEKDDNNFLNKIQYQAY